MKTDELQLELYKVLSDRTTILHEKVDVLHEKIDILHEKVDLIAAKLSIVEMQDEQMFLWSPKDGVS